MHAKAAAVIDLPSVVVCEFYSVYCLLSVFLSRFAVRERVTIMSQTNNNAESCGATGDAWSSLIAEYGSTD